MEETKLFSLLQKAKLGDYDSAMAIVSNYKRYSYSLMHSMNISDKVSCSDEIVRTILNCIYKF